MFKFSTSTDKMLCSVLFMIIMVNTSPCNAADDLEEVKPRRGGTVGLFAFPRVGRSDASLYKWDLSPNSYEEYDDLSKMEIKRQGLMAFPRVGRPDGQLRKWSKLAMQQNMEKRSGPSASSGLWFGPRLGRIQKRNADSGGLPDDNRLDVYTPRLGRESDEIFDANDYIMLNNLADLKPFKNQFSTIYGNLFKN